MSKPPAGYYLSPGFFYKYPALYDIFGPWLGLHKLWREVCRALDPQPGEIILDVCSGTGALALNMAKRLNGQGGVLGADLTPQMVRRARGKVSAYPLHFLRAFAEALPFPEATFHKASITLALHEMPQPARARVLAEIYRVTRPGGRVVVGEFWPSRQWYVRLFDKIFEEPQWVKEMAGLSQELERSQWRVLRQEVLPVGHFQVAVAQK